MKLVPGPNARLKPTMPQITVTTPIIAKLCIRVDKTFFRRTKPP
jgi:hypothetical protein